MKTAIVRKTPIGALLFVAFIDSGLKLPEFVAEIGYGNIHKGIRAFQSFVNTGVGNTIFLERLQKSRFMIDPDALLDALVATETQLLTEQEHERSIQERERQRSFRPAIYAVPKLDRHAQITLFAVTSDLKEYSSLLPEGIATWPERTQYEYVQATIRESYHRHNGEIKLLGPIVSYLYLRTWNEPPLAFSIDGQLLGYTQQQPPRAEIRIRNTLVKRKLLAQFLCSRGETSFH